MQLFNAIRERLKHLAHFRGASILTVTTFLSYVLGLVRDRTLAHTFGATRSLDIYNAAFIVPDLILNIFVAGALSAAFIPVFSSILGRKEDEKANELGNTVLHAAPLLVAVICAAAFFLMPILAPLISSGFNLVERESLITYSRIFLISPILFALSNSLGSMLISYRKYLFYGLAPVLYNAGIIGGALLAARYGTVAVVAGTLFGALLHLAVRFIGIFRTSFLYRPAIHIKSPEFRKIGILMLPKMIGHPIEPLEFMIFTNLASLLAAGSIAVLNFSRNFQSVPVSLFGISFSLAVFPLLSEAARRGDRYAWLLHFKRTFWHILLFTVPSAIGLFFLSWIPIRIFLGGGSFTAVHVSATATMLSFFALSIPTESVTHLLARSFYSLKNTLTPVLVSVCGLAIGGLSAWQLLPSLHLIAIPVGFSLGSLFRAVALGVLLKSKLSSFPFMKADTAQ